MHTVSRALALPLLLSMSAGMLSLSLPARAADKAPAEEECTQNVLADRLKCIALKKAKDKLKNIKPITPPVTPPDDNNNNDKKSPAPPRKTRPPLDGVQPPVKEAPPKKNPPDTHTPVKNPRAPANPPSHGSPPPDNRAPHRGKSGGSNKADCCAMAGLGAGGLIIGGLTGLLAGAAVGGGIGFFLVTPDPKTDAQRAIDGGFGAVIGGGAGAFLGGAIGLGLGLAAGGVVAGGEE